MFKNLFKRKNSNEYEMLREKYNFVTSFFHKYDETEVDLSKFKSVTIKHDFVDYLKRMNISVNSSRELMAFNIYLAIDGIYTEGILECLDYCHNKKNKKTSIENQLIQSCLTSSGKEQINEILNND